MTLAVTLTVEELEALMTRAASRAVAETSYAATATPPAEVLTRLQVAELLHVNPHQIPALIKQGLPMHPLGDTTQQRYLRSEVLEWVAKREKENP